MKKNKPRIHITVNTVRALPPSFPNKKIFDWDDEVRGFGSYRTSGGVVVFVYQYRLPHQPARRAKIGEFGDLTPNQARDIARGMAVERRGGVDPVERRREDARERLAARDLRFGTYVDAYLQRRIVEGRPVNQQHSRILVNDVAGLMPNIRIDRLTPSDIDRWQAELQKRSKSARIYGLVYLKVILNDAKSRGLIASSPADAYKVPPQVERERFLSHEELTRMLEALHDMRDMHADVLECLLRTLRRKEEIAALPWKEIDQRTWTWTLPAERSKTKTTYVMDLPSQVVAILERQQPDPAKRTGWVFTFDGTRSIVTGSQAKDTLDANIQRRIELATANGQPPLEMEQWNFHDFRTTGGTHMGDDPLRTPKADDHTPQTAVVTAEIQGEKVEIDFLHHVKGVKDDSLQRQAVQLVLTVRVGDRTGTLNIPIMHPLHCMQSRLANVVELHRDTDLAKRQLEASPVVLGEYLSERLDAGAAKHVTGVLQSLHKWLMTDPTGRKAHHHMRNDPVRVLDRFIEDARLDERWRKLSLTTMRDQIMERRTAWGVFKAKARAMATAITGSSREGAS